MSDTSGGNLTLQGATFDAFGDRGRSGVLIGACFGYLVLALAIFGAFGFFFWSAIGDYFNWSIQMSQMKPGAASAFIMPPQSVLRLAPAYVLTIFCGYVLLAALEAACLRWLVRGETGGLLLGLGLGPDTWRVWLGYWLWFVMFMGAYIGTLISTLIVIGVLSVARLDAGIVALGGVGAALIGVGVWIWIAVRLAPAAATSIALNRFSFFGAWSVTRGRFWSLLGSYLVLIVLYFVTILAIFGVGFGLLLGSALARFASAGGKVDPAAFFAALATPQTVAGALIVYAIYIAAAFTFLVSLFGVNGRAALVAKQEGRIS